jgi:hypothetical protein
VAARSKAYVMDVGLWFLCFSTLCCPAYVEALRRDHHSSKESYQMSLIHEVTKDAILNWDRP